MSWVTTPPPCAPPSMDDRLLRRAIESPDSRVSVLGHTRWASVGIISEPNTHPLNSIELEQPAGAAPPYVVAALNGDVDNHADLRAAHGLRIAVSDHHRCQGHPDAHVASCWPPVSTRSRRSVAPSANSRGRWPSVWPAPTPPARSSSHCAEAVRGCTSGSATTATIMASEPYGVVEETSAIRPHGR